MDKVFNFRIDDAIKIININPQALFEKVCYEPNNEKVMEDSSPLDSRSPLQQAFWGLDSYMWNSIYESIKEDPELLKLYKKRLLEVEDHFDIQPLISAYDIYIKFYRDEETDLSYDNPKREKAVSLFKNVRIQQDFLPMHMIYEMCRPNAHKVFEINYDETIKKEYFNAVKYTWLNSENDKFPDAGRFEISNNPPPPPKIMCFHEEQGNKITPPVNKLKDLEKLEKLNFGALVRGDYTCGAFTALAHGGMTEDDKQLFLKLHEIRLKEFLDHKELILGNSCINEHFPSLNQ